MAGRGRAPSGQARARERDEEARLASLTVVVPDGEPRGPDLPDLPEGCEWPPATLRWWATWRESPQASTFTDTDWSFLIDTAVLHAEFWLGNAKVAGELRLRVAKFGATPEDRARLKLEVGEPGKKPAAGPTPREAKKAAERKSRLLTSVKDTGAAAGA